MSEQVQKKKGQAVVIVDPPEQDQKDMAIEDKLDIVDDLLDEIDSLLEENAEEFVKNFVQRGGQ